MFSLDGCSGHRVVAGEPSACCAVGVVADGVHASDRDGLDTTCGSGCPCHFVVDDGLLRSVRPARADSVPRGSFRAGFGLADESGNPLVRGNSYRPEGIMEDTLLLSRCADCDSGSDSSGGMGRS